MITGDKRMTMFRTVFFTTLLSAGISAFAVVPGKGKIVVLADKVTHNISPLTTGACIEDVNHEVYGGIYSQMI
ncbi:MAG: hypothetical protein ABFD91_04910, partial [Anaerohalosphaeraceae bacterium]